MASKHALANCSGLALVKSPFASAIALAMEPPETEAIQQVEALRPESTIARRAPKLNSVARWPPPDSEIPMVGDDRGPWLPRQQALSSSMHSPPVMNTACNL